MAHIAKCQGCEASVTITDHGIDVHTAVDAAGCRCCPEDHHHGQAANEGEPCRPLEITLLPGSVTATPVGA